MVSYILIFTFLDADEKTKEKVSGLIGRFEEKVAAPV
jgi:hypothetical protein